MKNFPALLILAALSINSYAEEVFKEADINAGKALLEKHCIQCHASSYGGNGSEIYTRDYRKIKSQRGLLAQVRNCNTMLNLKWFEDEERDVAAYLNQQYYHY